MNLRNWHGGPLRYERYADVLAYRYAAAVARSLRDVALALEASAPRGSFTTAAAPPPNPINSQCNAKSTKNQNTYYARF